MTKLSQILGFVFLIAGLILAVLIAVMPGSMQVLGLMPDVAAILLVGGAICIGLSGVVDALGSGHVTDHEHDLTAAPSAAIPAFKAEKPKFEPPPRPSLKPDFKAKEAAATIAAGAALEAVQSKGSAIANEVSPSVSETINALEQAKTEIAAALGMDKSEAEPVAAKPATPARSERPSIAAALERPVKAEPPPPPPPPPPPVEPPAVDEAEEADDPDLYVVEEKVIRGRPARVLSDGTVEAETDEGWMRFENLDHLDEYLDAMSPGA